MKLEIMCLLVWLVVLTGSSQTEEMDSSPGQSSVSPPAFIPATLPDFTSIFPTLTEDPGNEAPGTPNPPDRDETSTDTTTTQTEETVSSESATDAVSTTHLSTTSPAVATDAPVVLTGLSATTPTAASDDLSSPPTGQHTILTTHLTASLISTSPASFSSQPDHTVQDASSITPATTKPGSDPSTTGVGQTTGRHQTPQAPAGPQHQEVPSELNVGDEEFKKSHHHPRSPLDPLVAGLLSVFIITTAIVFVILFLKFKQRTNHPEFHRLQDLPMDDLMEDTPLSRYSY